MSHSTSIFHWCSLQRSGLLYLISFFQIFKSLRWFTFSVLYINNDTCIDLLLSFFQQDLDTIYLVPRIFWFFFVHTPDYLLLYFFQTTVITTLHQGRYHGSFKYSTPLAHWFLCTLNRCAACHDILHFKKCTTACIPQSCWTFHVCQYTSQIFGVKFLFLDTSWNGFPFCLFSNILQIKTVLVN